MAAKDGARTKLSCVQTRPRMPYNDIVRPSSTLLFVKGRSPGVEAFVKPLISQHAVLIGNKLSMTKR